MRGSIFKRGNLWTVQIERDRDPLTGKRRRELHSYRTKREAEEARVEILSRLQRGEYVGAVEAHLRRLPARPLAADPGEPTGAVDASSPMPATSGTTSSRGSAQRGYRGSQRTC